MVFVIAKLQAEAAGRDLRLVIENINAEAVGRGIKDAITTSIEFLNCILYRR